MADHYCCKRCGQEYSACTCGAKRADRFEEIARSYLTGAFGKIDSGSYGGGPTSADVANLSEMLRQAERDGALRAINAALTELRPTYRVSVANLERLRARIQKGDLP